MLAGLARTTYRRTDSEFRNEAKIHIEVRFGSVGGKGTQRRRTARKVDTEKGEWVAPVLTEVICMERESLGGTRVLA